MMRSPPPPSQQTPNAGYGGGGNPYQPSPAQGGAAGNYGPGFPGFMSDPTAQMGFQVGKSAMAAGQEYMEQNVCHPGKISVYRRVCLIGTTVQSLCVHTRSQALLQRLELLRPEQSRARPLPVATQALVPPAG